jgi:hypothetical protein
VAIVREELAHSSSGRDTESNLLQFASDLTQAAADLFGPVELPPPDEITRSV